MVWGDCRAIDSEKKTRENTTACSPNFTCRTIFASRESLYFETDWEPLYVRGKTQKLTIMYKIHNNLVPDCLSNIVQDMRCNASAYYTRNSQNYSIPVCRLQIYKSSFVSSLVNEWNFLPSDARDLSS